MLELRMHLTNSNRSSEVELRWDILETPPAQRWSKMFLDLVRSQKPFFPRFTGFDSPEKDMLYLQKKLNQCIQIINDSKIYKIEERADSEFNQIFANKIHHHFEVLTGAVERPTLKWLLARSHVKKAISGLNYCIHDMEALHKTQRAASPVAALIMECKKRVRKKMPKEFLPYFQLDFSFGDLFLHYSIIGKTWWEIFLDQDEEIFPNAVRPLRIISGEFDIFFYESKQAPEFLIQFHDFLRKHGQDPQNPELAIGYLPVARFRRDKSLTDLEYRKLIAQHLNLQEAHLLSHGKVLGSLKFDLSPYSFDLV